MWMDCALFVLGVGFLLVLASLIKQRVNKNKELN